MNAKAYYLTTLGDWQRHSARFANSHWLALDELDELDEKTGAAALPVAGISDATRILLLVEADEGAHLALEDDAAFEALPHPLAQRPVSAATQAALAKFGVASGANTFDAAEAAGRIHPLLRHRVF